MSAFTRKNSPDAARADAVLLLDDATDDALVPLSAAPSAPARSDSGLSSPIAARLQVRVLTDVRPDALRDLIVWARDPEPAFGWRRVLLIVSGINLGPSRRERRLRRLFCELYRHSHDPIPDQNER